jgi:hypothetical protein
MRIALAFVTLATVVTASCSSSEPSAKVDGDSIPEAQFGQEVARAACAAIQGCCSSGGRATNSCTEAATAIQTRLVEASRRGGRVYDGKRARRCISKYIATLETCRPNRLGLPFGYDEDCYDTLHGTAQVGARCDVANRCAAGSYCALSAEQPAQGTCVRMAQGKRGASCLPGEPGSAVKGVDSSITYSTCAGGDVDLFCDQASRTCVTADKLPPDCGPQRCSPDSYCHPSRMRCSPKLAVGEKCVVPTFEQPNECLDGSCDPESSRCKAYEFPQGMCSGESLAENVARWFRFEEL